MKVFCEVCNNEIPEGDPQYICDECQRLVCDDCCTGGFNVICVKCED